MRPAARTLCSLRALGRGSVLTQLPIVPPRPGCLKLVGEMHDDQDDSDSDALTRSKVRTLGTHAWEFAQRQWPAVVLAALLVLVLAVAGWRMLTATPATTITTTTPGYARVCVAGVSYLQFKSGATAEWTPAGKVKTCAEPASK